MKTKRQLLRPHLLLLRAKIGLIDGAVGTDGDADSVEVFVEIVRKHVIFANDSMIKLSRFL